MSVAEGFCREMIPEEVDDEIPVVAVTGEINGVDPDQASVATSSGLGESLSSSARASSEMLQSGPNSPPGQRGRGGRWGSYRRSSAHSNRGNGGNGSHRSGSDGATSSIVASTPDPQSESPLSSFKGLGSNKSWLLRLFESKLFDAAMAMAYLFNSKETGVLVRGYVLRTSRPKTS
jgi:hypothetical protein